MSFRLRLFLFLFLAVLIGEIVDIIRDYQELNETYTTRVEQTLDQVALFAQTITDFSSDPPVFSSPDLNITVPEGGSFSVLRGSEMVLHYPQTIPATSVTRTYSTTNGYTVQLEVDKEVFNRQMVQEFRRDLLDDVLQIVSSLIIAWLLSGFLFRPLKTLNAAINAVSLQKFPEPIPVPPGKDVLSQLATSFNRMSANIQAAIDRERVFTRYASHELRTPLSAMKLQLESLEMGLSSAEKVAPIVQRNLERMQRVLEALLSLARAKEKNHEPVPLVYLVRESIQVLPKESQARVVVKSSISPNLKVPQPYLMGQCVLNLIDNAIKYTQGQVRVTLEPFEGRVRVRVEDEGEGVPEEMLDKLTHTFFRLSSTVEGSGLGLAFVKHIVRTFEGELDLRNTGRGLEVVLTLPVAP
jgi:signal transduction histidine kinase